MGGGGCERYSREHESHRGQSRCLHGPFERSAGTQKSARVLRCLHCISGPGRSTPGLEWGAASHVTHFFSS